MRTRQPRQPPRSPLELASPLKPETRRMLYGWHPFNRRLSTEEAEAMKARGLAETREWFERVLLQHEIAELLP